MSVDTKFRFFATRSGRLYVASGSRLYFYDRSEQVWELVDPKDRTLEQLASDPRTHECESELDFDSYARRVFRTQFAHDSRLASQFQPPMLPPWC